MTATASRRGRKPAAAATQQAELQVVGEIVAIDRALLHPGEYQTRDLFEEGRIAELAESIKSVGIRQPLLVRPDTSQPGTYSIVAGERRWRASALAGLSQVPCVVETAMGDEEHALTTAIENLQRENLTTIEEAKAFAVLQRFGDLDAAAIAGKVGRSEDYIRDSLRLLALPERVLTMLHTGTQVGKEGDEVRPTLKLSRSQGLALARRHNPERDALTVAVAEQALVNAIPAKSLESDDRYRSVLANVANAVAPKSGTITVENARALPVFSMPQDSPVLESNCFNCPFGAYVGDKRKWGTNLCTKPSHYLELLERKKRDDAIARAAAEQAALADMAARGEDGSAVRPLQSYPYGSYIRFDDPGAMTGKAAGCNDQCACRRVASLPNGAGAVTICCDATRFHSLKRKETMATNKSRRQDAAARTSEVASALDTLAATPLGYDDRAIRIVALAALEGITSGAKKVEDAGRHVVGYLGRPTLFKGKDDYSPHLLRKVGEEALAEVPTGNLVRFAVEALARWDLVQYSEQGGLGKYAAMFRPLGEPSDGAGGADVGVVEYTATDWPQLDKDRLALYQAAMRFVQSVNWVPADACILVELPDDRGNYYTLDADAAQVADAIGIEEELLGRCCGFAFAKVLGPQLENLIARLVEQDEDTLIIFPTEGPPVMQDGEGVTVLDDEALTRTEDGEEIDPVPEGVAVDAGSAEVAEHLARRDWAYETLAQGGKEAADFVVLHACDNGDLLAFGEDATYLVANFGFGVEELGGLVVSRIGARDAERMQRRIVDDGFALALVPREGPGITLLGEDETPEGATLATPEPAGDLAAGLDDLEALATASA